MQLSEKTPNADHETFFRSIVDVNIGVIKRDRVLIQDTSTAQLYVGFGCRTALLKQLADDEAILKAGYDPAQTRDSDGRWSKNPGSAKPAKNSDVKPSVDNRLRTAVAPISMGEPLLSRPLGGLFSATLGRLSLAALERLALTFAAGITVFLGAYFVSFKESPVLYGTLPDHPDINYHYDDDTGRFSLSTDDDGVVFEGRAGADGLIRTDSGDIIGRRLGDTVVIDSSILPLEEVDGDAESRTNTAAIAATSADKVDPNLCPDPEPDVGGYKSPRSMAYQQYINLLVNPVHPISPGLAVYYFNPVTGRYVSIDDCDQQSGDPAEAKGPGIARMIKNQKMQGFLTPRFRNQANRQLDATGGRPITWYADEPETTEYFRKIFSEPRYSRITVVNAPMPLGKYLFV
jgi:hypothetical protein